MIKPAGKELGHKEVEVHKRADRVRVEAGGDGHTVGGGDPPDGHLGADLLPLEEGVRRVGVGELRHLKSLEEEKLKQLVADLSLGKHILQDVLAKSSDAWASARARRARPGIPSGKRTA